MRISKQSITMLKFALMLSLLPQPSSWLIPTPVEAKSAKQCNDYVCTKGKCKMFPVCAIQKAAMKNALAAAATASNKLENEFSKLDCNMPPEEEKVETLLASVEESLCSVNSLVKNCTPPKRSNKAAKTAWKELGEMTLSALDRIERVRRLVAKQNVATSSRTALQSEAHELVSEVYGLNTLLESAAP